MRGAYLLALNNTPIKSKEDVIQFFSQQPQSHATVTIKMGTVQKIAMHPDDWVPIMYFDQLNVIAHHLRQIKYRAEMVQDINMSQSVQPPSTRDKVTTTIKMLQAIFIDGIKTHTAAMNTAHTLKPKSKHCAKKLMRRILKQQHDWHKWEQSEWKQLNQYEEQETFGPPCHLPLGANCLSLLWTYVVKDGSGISKMCL